MASLEGYGAVGVFLLVSAELGGGAFHVPLALLHRPRRE